MVVPTSFRQNLPESGVRLTRKATLNGAINVIWPIQVRIKSLLCIYSGFTSHWKNAEKVQNHGLPTPWGKQRRSAWIKIWVVEATCNPKAPPHSHPIFYSWVFLRVRDWWDDSLQWKCGVAAELNVNFSDSRNMMIALRTTLQILVSVFMLFLPFQRSTLLLPWKVSFASHHQWGLRRLTYNLQTRSIIPQLAVAIENLETMPSRYFLMGLHDEYDPHIYCYTRLLLPHHLSIPDLKGAVPDAEAIRKFIFNELDVSGVPDDDPTQCSNNEECTYRSTPTSGC